MIEDRRWRWETIVRALQDLLPLRKRRGPHDPLRDVTASDPVLDSMDTFRGPRWLPIKVQVGLGLALVALIKGAVSGGRVMGVLAALAVLLPTGVVWVIDVVITRRRRANRRPPMNFG